MSDASFNNSSDFIGLELVIILLSFLFVIDFVPLEGVRARSTAIGAGILAVTLTVIVIARFVVLAF